MTEREALRAEIAALRVELRDAKRAIEAFARGEVDAVAHGAGATPILLEAAQAELRQSRSLLRAIFDASLDALLLADDQGVYVDANAAACKLLGCPREKIIGRPIGEFTLLTFDAGAFFREFLTTGSAQGRFPLVQSDGARRVLDFSALANVAPGLHLSALRDVTERVDAEETLRRSEARFRAMIEKSHDGISLVTTDGKSLYQSPAVDEITGRGAVEARDLGWTEYVEDDQRPVVQKALEALLAGGPSATVSVELRLRRPDGSRRWLDLSATNLLHDPDVSAIVTNFRDVTERKAAEDERDGFFRLSLDLLGIGGVDGRFRRLNPAWEATLGWSLDELCAAPWLDFVHPDDRAMTEREGAKLAAGGISVRFENRYRCKGGGYRRLQWCAMPSPETGLIYACVRDVTEEREAAARDRLLFSASPVPIWLLDGETHRILDVNDAALASYGYAREEFLALSVYDLVLEAEHADVRSRLQRLPPDQGGYAAHRRHRTKSGAVRDVRVSYYGLNVGDRPAILSVAIDVTEALRAEAALRASEQRYRRIVDNASEGIWMYDTAGTTTFVNKRMAEMLGCTVAEATGQPIFRFMDEEGRKVGHERLERRKAGIREDISEFRLTRRDGSDLWVSVKSDPLLDERGNLENVLSLVTDITERRRAEAALRESEEHLRQAQKLDAIGSLASGIAHDFNNLLSVILTYTNLLVEDLQPGDPMRADLEEVRRAGERATELTRQLLAFSRKQILEPAVVDMNAVVLGVEKMLGRLLGEDVDLILRTAPYALRVNADQGQLEQVIVNLAVNARDAMPEGGKITIETSSVLLDEAYAAMHHGVTPGPHVLLAVTDTGTGMSREVQQRVFEPFFTTKPTGRGTGLGLAMVYGIVQQSGGHIWLYSELGLGTTFKIYLPKTERLADGASQRAPSTEVRAGTETILLVEDEAPVRNVVRLILRKHGYDVLEAQNGGEALLLCDQFTAPIHMLLTDVVMPLMSGRQLAERLGQLRPQMKILFMSGYTEDTIVHHGVLDAGIAYLAKPIQPDALLRKVRQVLDSRERGGSS